MSHVECPGCGGQFALDRLGDLAEFSCSECGMLVEVPRARLARGGGRPRRAAGGRSSRRDAETEPRSGPPVGLLVGGGIALLAVVAIVVAMLPGGDNEETAAVPIGMAPGDPGVGLRTDMPVPPAGDPDRDPAAWKALSAEERRARATELVVRGSSRDESVISYTIEFLKERDELDAVEKLAARHVRVHADCKVARGALGQEEVMTSIERTLRKCELADEVDAEPVMRLREMARAQKEDGRSWWCSGDTLREVKELIAEVEAMEKELESDAAFGRAKWIQYQRTIEVMKDYPSLHGVVGPYLIFVQIEAPQAKHIGDVPPEKLAAAKKVLEQNIELFGAMYEAWMTELGPLFGFTRYDENSVNRQTILKANIFSSKRDYLEYNIRNGMAGVASSARAYYSVVEPRFICTYVGGKDEEQAKANQVQCHEATHQLHHFYTWDVSRQALGKAPGWRESKSWPLWSGEGFAEFFSSHTVENGKYEFMQPLVSRLSDIWVLEEIVDERKWKPWPLEQIIRMRHGGQLNSAGAARGGVGEGGLAQNVMANLFYGKAWSLVYFTWYAEENGRPKYRDKAVAYFKREFNLRPAKDRQGRIKPGAFQLVTAKDFKEAFGLTDPADFAAFEAEWQAYERAMIQKFKTPAWDEERARVRKIYRLDGSGDDDE